MFPSHDLNGTIIECGLHEIFDRAFDEVHASNMTKSLSDKSKAEEEAKMYCNKTGYNVNIVKNNNKYILVREFDGKVIKLTTYQPANIKVILEAFRAKQILQNPMNI